MSKLAQLSYLIRSYKDPQRRALLSAQLNNSFHLSKFLYEKDFIFIHINKTAGSSISKLLDVDRMHLTAYTIRNLVREDQWKSKFKFAFVRNPWDRVVSQYHHRLGVNQQNLKSEKINFKDWVKACYVDQDKTYVNFYTMFIPQLDWITDMNGDIIIDFVGKYENLNEDVKTIQQILKISKPLPHLRSSKRSHYSSYFDANTKNIIGDYFDKDIKYFGYNF